MKRALSALLVLLAAAPASAQGDFVVNYRGLMAGRGLVTNGFVDFYRSDTAYRVRLQAPTGLAASRTFTLPATLGTAGQALRTDGAGATSWVTYLLPSDLGSTVQAYHANLGAIAGLTYGANLCTYWTGAGVAATMSCTSAGRSMLGAADAAAQTALLNSFTGDSGSGGVKGLVTAPASGDALKFLRGDATWQTVDTTITHGVTARSGCVAGGVSRSTSNLEDCGAGLTYNGTTFSVGSGADTLSIGGNSGFGPYIGIAGSFFSIRGGVSGTIFASSNGASNWGLFDSSGLKVGNGSSPNAKLEVGGVTGTTVAATINNGTSTGNILNLQDNGTTVLAVPDGGDRISASYNGTFKLTNTWGGTEIGLTNIGSIAQVVPTYGQITTHSGPTKQQSLEYGIGKALTESSDTNVVLVSISSNAAAGGYMEYVIEADDGTDFQTRTGRFNFSITNKAGTETCGLSAASEAADGSSVAASTGTLTYSITCDTSPTNGVYLRFNAVSSLTQTTLRVHGYKISGWSNSNGGPNTFTFAAQ